MRIRYVKKREAAPTLSPRLALAIGILAVSSGSIFVRIAQEDAPSLTIAAFRLGLAALILLPVAWLRCREELLELKASDWGWALASGFFLAIHFGTWITSLEYTSVASSVVLVSTSPLWVALAARVFLDEPLPPALLAGLSLAMGGSIVISFAESSSGFYAQPLLGNALALAGALAVSGYWLIGRHLRRHMSLIPYVTLVYGFAALTLLITALLFRQPLTGFRPTTYGWFLLLALVPQLLGHSTFNWSLAHLPAAYVAIATLGEPIGAAILAFIFLGENPSLLKMAAVALILVGILLILRQSPGKIEKTRLQIPPE
ncbi:MAG: DMT family transporter [Candidatus Aminicenantes bacterium]|nr:DMT family transporter [Candidatus Aminicenantes bacterium]